MSPRRLASPGGRHGAGATHEHHPQPLLVRYGPWERDVDDVEGRLVHAPAPRIDDPWRRARADVPPPPPRRQSARPLSRVPPTSRRRAAAAQGGYPRRRRARLTFVVALRDLHVLGVMEQRAHLLLHVGPARTAATDAGRASAATRPSPAARPARTRAATRGRAHALSAPRCPSPPPRADAGPLLHPAAAGHTRARAGAGAGATRRRRRRRRTSWRISSSRSASGRAAARPQPRASSPAPSPPRRGTRGRRRGTPS